MQSVTSNQLIADFRQVIVVVSGSPTTSSSHNYLKADILQRTEVTEATIAALLAGPLLRARTLELFSQLETEVSLRYIMSVCRECFECPSSLQFTCLCSPSNWPIEQLTNHLWPSSAAAKRDGLSNPAIGIDLLIVLIAFNRFSDLWTRSEKRLSSKQACNKSVRHATCCSERVVTQFCPNWCVSVSSRYFYTHTQTAAD